MQIAKRDRPFELPVWRELEELGKDFEKFFPRPFFSARVPQPGIYMPAVALAELDNEIVLKAELPGLKLDEVTLEINDDILTIKGEKKDELEEKRPRYHVWERTFGAFERSFTLPRGVDAEKIKAGFVSGVLTVHLPKVEVAKGRKIDIANH